MDGLPLFSSLESKLFEWQKYFNDNISSWDVSSVTDMGWMFYYASSFNQDLSSWDVSSVTSMDSMFRDASSFNQDLCAWVTKLSLDLPSMYYTFNGTACGYQSDPIEDTDGFSPSCASSCKEDQSSSPSIRFGKGLQAVFLLFLCM